MSIKAINLHLNSTIEGALQELRKKIEDIRSPSASKVVYSAILGGYDSGYDVVDARSDADYVLFYDGKKPVVNGWVLQKLNFSLETPQRTAKLIKVLPHLIFPMYVESIWIDANRVIKEDLYSIPGLDKNVNFAMHRHNKRTSVRQEVKECIRWRKDAPKKISAQYARYISQGFSDDVGLYCGAFIYRRHLEPDIKTLMECWWYEIISGSVRDQISLPFCCWINDIYPKTIQGNVNDNNYFEAISHKKPYKSDGSITGQALSILLKLFDIFGIFVLIRYLRSR